MPPAPRPPLIRRRVFKASDLHRAPFSRQHAKSAEKFPHLPSPLRDLCVRCESRFPGFPDF